MLRLGLTRAELQVFHAGLCRTHERSIELQVLNLDGRVLRSLTPMHLDGQVTIDATTDDQTPSRILNLTFLDPGRSLGFEPDSPAAAPLHRSRMIRVIDSRRVPGLDFWVDCPVFVGPIWDFDRNGPEVRVVAHGKERQAMGSRWKGRTFAKKSRKTTMIRTLLEDAGETRMVIPDLRATLPNRLTIGRLGSSWAYVCRVARSMDRHPFYDGAGTFRLRAYGMRPVLVFHEALLGEPEIRRSVEGVVNTVWVVGGKPKGQKKRVQAVSTLPARHPLSPESLGRDGAPLRLAERHDNPHIKTIAEAKRKARRIRDDRATTTTEFAFDVLPFPHLDELDMVAVDSDDGRLLVRMRQWSIPLGPAASPMTVGSLRRTTRARARR